MDERGFVNAQEVAADGYLDRYGVDLEFRTKIRRKESGMEHGEKEVVYESVGY